MLEFYFIPDDQPTTAPNEQLTHAGSVAEEEFEMAQKVGLAESLADYYGKFRWSSEQVRRKEMLLASCPFRTGTALHAILAHASAAGVGLLACGD